MRRIPRLRRPSGTSAAAATASAAKQSIAPLACPSPAARAPFLTRPASVTTAATPASRAPASYLPRFYSTDGNNNNNNNNNIPQSLADQLLIEAPIPTPPQERQEIGTPIVGKRESSDDAEELVPQQVEAEAEAGAGAEEPPSALYVAPPRRTRAARFDEVADARYVPAPTGDGLETVGGVARWWEARAHWRGDFAGFRPPRRTTDPALLEAAARRAVVEALALRRSGREDDLVGPWPLASSGARARGEARTALGGVRLAVVERGGDGDGDGDGGREKVVELSGDVEGVLEGLRWRDDGEETALVVAGEEQEEGAVVDGDGPSRRKKKTVLSAKDAATYREGWDKSWKNVPLDDARLKFAVTKRIFQLTGQMIPDHKLPEISSVQSLLRVLQKPPKPRTLTEEITKRQPELLANLPNVAFSAKRVTRGDKEKAVGRFKLIEEEFRKRDLPLEGHGFVRKNKERSWLRGGV